MRIISISTSFPNPENKVSGIFVYNLLEALSKKHEVFVVTPSYKGVGYDAMLSNLTVLSCRYAPEKLETLAHSPGGIPAAIKSRPFLGVLLLVSMICSLFFKLLQYGYSADIVYANWSIGGFISLPLKLIGKKIIVTLRGDDVARAQKNARSRFLLGFLISNADEVVTVSQDMKAWIDLQYKKPHKVTYIGNGLDSAFVSVGQQRIYSAEQTDIKFVCVGSLIPRKNIGLILQGLKQIGAEYNWTCAIIGDGIERASLVAQCENLGLAERVIFTGALLPVDVISILKESTIFLFSSHAEGKPNVVLEAMACGLAIIAPSIAGVNEIIKPGSNGLLFTPNDSNELASHLKFLLKNSQLIYQYGQEAVRTIQDNYGSWDDTAEKYSDLFQQVWNS